MSLHYSWCSENCLLNHVFSEATDGKLSALRIKLDEKERIILDLKEERKLSYAECPSCGEDFSHFTVAKELRLKLLQAQDEIARKDAVLEKFSSRDNWDVCLGNIVCNLILPWKIADEALTSPPSGTSLAEVLERMERALNSGEEIVFETVPSYACDKNLVIEALESLRKFRGGGR